MTETIDFPGGFQAQAISFDNQPLQKRIISPSCFSRDEAIDCAQLIEITDGEGTIMYFSERSNWMSSKNATEEQSKETTYEKAQ